MSTQEQQQEVVQEGVVVVVDDDEPKYYGDSSPKKELFGIVIPTGSGIDLVLAVRKFLTKLHNCVPNRTSILYDATKEIEAHIQQKDVAFFDRCSTFIDTVMYPTTEVDRTNHRMVTAIGSWKQLADIIPSNCIPSVYMMTELLRMVTTIICPAWPGHEGATLFSTSKDLCGEMWLISQGLERDVSFLVIPKLMNVILKAMCFGTADQTKLYESAIVANNKMREAPMADTIQGLVWLWSACLHASGRVNPKFPIRVGIDRDVVNLSVPNSEPSDFHTLDPVNIFVTTTSQFQENGFTSSIASACLVIAIDTDEEVNDHIYIGFPVMKYLSSITSDETVMRLPKTRAEHTSGNKRSKSDD